MLFRELTKINVHVYSRQRVSKLIFNQGIIAPFIRIYFTNENFIQKKWLNAKNKKSLF